MNHIRRAAKPWTCKGCGLAIEKGVRHFCEMGTTLPYGRYIGTMVAARWHLRCASESAACCNEAREQLKAELVR